MHEQMLVTGARRNKETFSLENMLHCNDACLFEIDFASKRILRSYVDTNPDSAILPRQATFSLRHGYFDGRTVHTCTASELRQIDYDAFELKRSFTHPLFNDLHYVAPINGDIYFVDTGLDHIGKMLPDDQVQLFPVLHDGETHKIELDKDYRALDTKPHHAHPNFLFQLDGKKWVTRFHQLDAVRLDDFADRIPLGRVGCHDGIVAGGRVYFSTVDGKIIVVDADTKSKLAEHDISAQYNVPALGWCRGIAVQGNVGYVGFTSIRKTKHRENIKWLTNTIEAVRGENPSRIVKFDLDTGKVLDEIVFPKTELAVIFSLLLV
jgi:hypothetical protein